MELFFKSFYRQRKRYFFIILTNSLAIFLVFITSFFSDYLNNKVDESVTDISADVSMLILPQTGYEEFLKDNQITDYMEIYQKQYGDYTLLSVNGNTDLLSFNISYGRNINNMDLLQGDALAVVGNDVYEYKDSIVINGIEFKVIGVLSENNENMYYELDKTIIIPGNYLFDDMMEKLYFRCDRDVELYLKEKYGTDYTLIDQGTVKKSFNLITKSAGIVMMFLAISSMIISLIGMLNMSLSQLSQRKKEIAIKKALGATDKDIVKEMLSEAVLVMVFSILLSAIMISLVLMVINVATKERITINVNKVFNNIMIILVSGIMFSLIPAYKASKITILQAMKNQD